MAWKNELLSVVVVFGVIALMAGFMSGCGSNPSGADAASLSTTASGTTTAVTSAATRLLGKVVSATSNSTLNVGGINVKLLRDGTTLKASYSTEASGEFFFNDLAEGIYVLRVDKTSDYNDAAQVIEVKSGMTNTAPNLQLFSTTKISDIPTVDLTGTLTAALDNAPLSVAQVTLDSGQTTVTNAFGYFYFPYVASGTRKITISKPGLVASYTISFEVKGTSGKSVADKLVYLGADYLPIVNNEPSAQGTTSYGATRLVKLGTIAISYDIHLTSAFIGTVLQRVKDPSGKLTSQLASVPNFEFELWVTDGTKYDKFRTVVTDNNGTWKVDNVPHQGDNGYHWMAVASGSIQQVFLANDGSISYYYVDNSFAPWNSNGLLDTIDVVGNRRYFDTYSPVYTTKGYVAEAGKTTIIDFEVPTFFAYPWK